MRGIKNFALSLLFTSALSAPTWVSVALTPEPAAAAPIENPSFQSITVTNPGGTFPITGMVNVMGYPYFANPDTRVSRNCAGTITGNVFAFTSCAFFQNTDPNAIIILMAAGGIYNGTVASYISNKSVQLSSSPGFTLNNASVWVYVGHDNSAAIQQASDAAAAMGAFLFFPPGPAGGCYGIAAPIALNTLGPANWLGGLSETNAANQSGCSIVNLGTPTQMLVGTVGVGTGQTSVMVYRPLGGVAPTYTTRIQGLTFDGTGQASPLRVDQVNRCKINDNIFKGAPAGSAIVQFGDGTNTGNAEGCVITDNTLQSENGSSGQPIPSNPYFHAAVANNPLIGFIAEPNTSDGHFDRNIIYGISGTGSHGTDIEGGGWFARDNHEFNGDTFHTDYPYYFAGVDGTFTDNSVDTCGTGACFYLSGWGSSLKGSKIQGFDNIGIEIASGVCGATISGNSFKTTVTAAKAIVQDGTACSTTQVPRTNGVATYTTDPPKDTFDYPGRFAASFYSPKVNGSAAAAIGAANTLYFLPFRDVPWSQPMASLNLNVTTGNGSAGWHWEGCVYADTGSQKPDGGALLADTGSIAVAQSATGVSSGTVSLSAKSNNGWYWIATMVDATGESVTSTTTGNGPLAQDLGSSTVAGAIAGVTTSGRTAAQTFANGCPLTAPTTSRVLTAGPIAAVGY